MNTTNLTHIRPLRQLVLRAAVEHGAAGWAQTPGCGRGDAARYIWETLGDDVRDRAECDWIAAYIAEHPEVFDLPAHPASTWDARRRELSDEADARALAAWKQGRFADAIAALDEAEALHPKPGKHFASAREQVAAKLAETSEPAFTVDIPGVLADFVADAIEQDGGPVWEAWKAAEHIPYRRGFSLRITGTADVLDQVTMRAETLLAIADGGEVSSSERRACRVWIERVARKTGQVTA